MQQAFAQLGGTVGVDAAVVHLAFGADYGALTLRTFCRKNKSLLTARMFRIFQNLDDFGNHVAAALDLDPVAELEAEALDEVGVVQRGAADGGAADEDRRQLGDRSELPYELAITRLWLKTVEGHTRPVIATAPLFRGHQGTLAVELWNAENKSLRGTIAPVFYTTAGEELNLPIRFEKAIRKITGAVACLGCKHTHIAVAPATNKGGER